MKFEEFLNIVPEKRRANITKHKDRFYTAQDFNGLIPSYVIAFHFTTNDDIKQMALELRPQFAYCGTRPLCDKVNEFVDARKHSFYGSGGIFVVANIPFSLVQQ